MSADQIANLRKRFEEEVSSHPDLYHPVDIERVRTEEFQVRRFLLDKDGDEDKAMDSLNQALRWKKEFGIHERTDQYFPKEFWELNQIEINGTDREGHIIQWGIQRNQYTFKETALIDKQFNAHVMEKLDRVAGEKGFAAVVDTNGAGLSNVDMDQSKFKVTILDYYPMTCQGMYFVDLPWLLSSVLKIIVSFMNPRLRQMVNYVKRQELTKYIDPQHIPAEIGGKREKHNFPRDLKPLDQLQRELGFSDKFVDQYYNYYKIPRTNK